MEHRDDLRYVLALAKAGSLARAARALEVDHTTVGRRIEALEANDALPKGALAELTDSAAAHLAADQTDLGRAAQRLLSGLGASETRTSW